MPFVLAASHHRADLFCHSQPARICYFKPAEPPQVFHHQNNTLEAFPSAARSVIANAGCTLAIKVLNVPRGRGGLAPLPAAAWYAAMPGGWLDPAPVLSGTLKS